MSDNNNRKYNNENTLQQPFLNKIQQYLRHALELDILLLCKVKDLFMTSQIICIIFNTLDFHLGKIYFTEQKTLHCC